MAHTSSNNTFQDPQDPIDPADLEAFLDEFFDTNMQELNIPGAAITVVQDGEIIFSRGVWIRRY